MDLETKTRLSKYQPLNPEDDTVHILKTFFKYLPAEGKSNLAKDIAGCKTDATLRQLASVLDTGILRPMLARIKPSQQTPAAGNSEPASGDEQSNFEMSVSKETDTSA